MTNINVVLRGLNKRIMTCKYIPPKSYKLKILCENAGCVKVGTCRLPGIQFLREVYLQLARGQCRDTTYVENISDGYYRIMEGNTQNKFSRNGKLLLDRKHTYLLELYLKQQGQRGHFASRRQYHPERKNETRSVNKQYVYPFISFYTIISSTFQSRTK